MIGASELAPATPASPPTAAAPTLPTNNPLNLRPLTQGSWAGQTGATGGFADFDTPQNGWNAADQNLLAKVNDHGAKSLTDIIGNPSYGWAPAADGNDPVSYAGAVATAVGVKPGDDISQRLLTDVPFRHSVLEAMAAREQGHPVSYGGSAARNDLAGMILTPDEQAELTREGAPTKADVGNPGQPSLGQTTVAAGDALHFLDLHGIRDQSLPSGSAQQTPGANINPQYGETAPAEKGAWWINQQGQLQRVGDPTPDYIPVFRANLAKQGGPTAQLVRGAFQGAAMDTLASAARLGLGNGDPLYNAFSQTQGGPSAFDYQKAAEEGFRQEQNAYALGNVGSQWAQGGRFGGQTIPALGSAAIVPEMEAPEALGIAGRFGAPLLTEAFRGGAAAASNIGANPNQSVVSQLATGAITGGVLSPFLHGAGAAGERLANAFSYSPEEKVANRVSGILQTSLARDNIAPDQAAADALAHPDRPAYHAGGPNVAAVADVAANTPGPAQATLRQAAAEHLAATQSGVTQDIGSALGGSGDYLSTLDRTIAARKAAADTGMAAIASSPVTLSPDAVTAMRSDLAQGAIKDAAQNYLTSVDPADRARGTALMRVLAQSQALDNPAAMQIDVRGAQDISKALLDGADSAFSGGSNARGVALRNLGRSLRDSAVQSSPDYQAWLGRYGDDSDNVDALRLGHGIFSNAQGSTAQEVLQAVSQMSPDALNYYRKGVAEALIDKSGDLQGAGVAAMRTMLGKSNIGQKIRAAFPDDQSYQAFVDAAQQRVSEYQQNMRILSGSPTAPRQAAAADLTAQPPSVWANAGHALDFVGNVAQGNWGRATSRVAGALASGLPRSDKSVLADSQTNALLGSALSDPQLFAQLVAPRPAPLAVQAVQSVRSVAPRTVVPLSSLGALQNVRQIPTPSFAFQSPVTIRANSQ